MGEPDVVRIDVMIPLFDEQINALTQTVVSVFYGAGGDFFKRSVSSTIFLGSYFDHPIYVIIADGLYVLLIVKMFLHETGEIVRHVKLRTWRHYLQVWEIIDWAVIFFSIGIVIGYQTIRSSVAILNTHVADDKDDTADLVELQ